MRRPRCRMSYKTPAYYRNIVEQAQDIILIMRKDGKLIDANQAAVMAYGYSLAELRQMSIHQLRPYKAQADLVAQLNQASNEGVIFRTLHVRKNGEEFPVEVSSRFIKSYRIMFVISIIRDISSTVALEDLLRKNEEKYRLLSEQQTLINEELTASEEELRQQMVELKRRDEKIEQKNFVLNLLHQTTLNLMQRLEVTELLETILTSATNLVKTAHAHLCLIDEENYCFVPIFATGNFTREINQKIPLSQGLTGEMYKTGELIVIDNYSKWRGRLANDLLDNLYCTVQFPLKSGNKVLGALGLSFDDPHRRFSEGQIEILLQFAELASIGLDNATLFSSYKTELMKRCALQANQQALLNAIPDVIFRIQQSGVILDYKGSKDMPFAVTVEDIGKNIYDVLPDNLTCKIREFLHQALVIGELQTFDYRHIFNYKPSHFEVRIVPSGAAECVIILSNVTERKMAEENLRYLSNHDIMTGLYNRTYFEKTMQQFEAEQPASAGIIICDVDGLKFVNDTLGHSVGDELLKNTAQILLQAFSTQIIARIGGDEFAVIMRGRLKDFEAVVHAIQQRIAEYNKSGPCISLSLSIGYAMSEVFPLDMFGLFKKADNIMYREKLLKKNSAKSAIIQGLVSALEARDFITDGHSTRLEELIFTMAMAINLSEQKIPDLRLFAKFHDIGKVGIPDHILMKPGRLNAEEFTIMQQHSEIGYRIAKSVPDLEPIAELILKHHEWWDGNGYPFALKGPEIPIECRMLAIADAYDAMTNDRPYRKAIAPAAAAAELVRCAGTQFDAELVKIFINSILEI